jgi:putative addiction module component (TIGR02574 family)
MIPGMARTLSPDEIAELTVDQRLELIDALWDSLDEDELPLPPEDEAMLRERFAQYQRGELRGDEASVVIARLRSRLPQA